MQDLLNNIHEYLDHSGFNSTIKILEAEALEKKGIPLGTLPSDNANYEKEQFLDAFHNGDADMFFALWEDYYLTSDNFKTLEILCSVYFAIYPLLYNHPEDLEMSMDRFKRFLERRGEWAQEPEFLQYYALPYLPDPRSHPTFRVLFESAWLDKLEQELETFLNQLTTFKTPKLIEIMESISSPNLVERPSSKLGNEILDLKKSLKESTKREHDLLLKLNNMRSDYQQLITVSGELVSTLMSAVNNERIEPSYLADIVKRLSRLNKPASNSGYEARPPKDDKPAQKRNPIRAQKQAQKVPKSLLSLVKLIDFSLIQEECMKAASDYAMENLHVQLINSMRLLLLNCSSIAQRREMLEYMIEQDFLGMNEFTLLPYLLRHPSIPIREAVSKMLNSLSTDCLGRGYLLNHQGLIIQDIIQVMKLDPEETLTRQHLLGALQKLSLRRIAQSMMNKSDMINYLCSMLSNLNNCSEYTIEYGSALLMNLCLRTLGKKQACAMPEVILKILNDLIDYDNLQVKTYVNGCLYSLFSDKKMRSHALSIGMESQLEYLKQISDISLVKQIEFVIARLIDESEDAIVQDEESLDGEEDDENENDEEDSLDPEDSVLEPVDEALMKVYFKTGDSRKSQNKIAKAAEKKNVEFTPQQLLSMQIQLPALETTKKGKLNLPITKEEKEEFNFGFSTRPKVPRTPLTY